MLPSFGTPGSIGDAVSGHIKEDEGGATRNDSGRCIVGVPLGRLLYKLRQC